MIGVPETTEIMGTGVPIFMLNIGTGSLFSWDPQNCVTPDYRTVTSGLRTSGVYITQTRPDHVVWALFIDVDRALNCRRGGFTIQRHNELRDLTASLLTDVCHNVATEPPLQPLGGELFNLRSANTNPQARLDIKARGFWNRGQDAFFDVRVFNPNAPSYRNQDISNLFSKHEREKKREYNQRVLEVENSVFTPLVFSTSGGMSKECTVFYKG